MHEFNQKRANRYTFVVEHLIELTVALCLTVSLILLIIASALNASATIHPADYMTFTYGFKDGYSGVTVGTEFDLNHMVEFYDDIVHFKNDCREEGEEWLKENGYDNVVELLCEYIVQPDENGTSTVRLDGTIVTPAVCGFDFAPDEYLRNGDTIVLHWNFFNKEDEFEELMEHLNVTFDYSDVEIKVSGIPD